jgi:hypothetical protein
MGSIASKILMGVATAAVWFALSHASRAEQICRQICDAGKSATMERAFPHMPGVGIDIGR